MLKEKPEMKKENQKKKIAPKVKNVQEETEKIKKNSLQKGNLLEVVTIENPLEEEMIENHLGEETTKNLPEKVNPQETEIIENTSSK